MLRRTIKLNKVQLKGMINNMGRELMGLEKTSKINEVKMKINMLEILLQEKNKEGQKSGCIYVKKVKWHVKELYKRKLRPKLSSWLDMIKEELSEVMYGQKYISEKE